MSMESSKTGMVVIDQVGALWIDFTLSVGHPCELEIASWHTGISCTTHLEDEVSELDQFVELGITLSMLSREAEAGHWIADIPREVIDELVRLEKLYYRYQFAALWFMSRSEAAIELFLSAPVLFYVLLDSTRSGRISLQRAMKLFTAPRKMILAESGLPPRRSCLRVLEALAFQNLSPYDLPTLRKYFTLSGWEQTNHVNHIDMILLKGLVRKPALLGSRLVASYGRQWEWREFSELCDDILRASRQLGRLDGYERIGACSSIGEIRGLHDRLVIELNKIILAEKSNITFGVPPLPGSTYIKPIGDARTLHEEGVSQQHCIAGYQRQILLGEYYAYSVFEPERATLGIKIDELGRPSIAQLKLCQNAEPSEQTIKSVRAWFEKERGVLSNWLTGLQQHKLMRSKSLSDE